MLIREATDRLVAELRDQMDDPALLRGLNPSNNQQDIERRSPGSHQARSLAGNVLLLPHTNRHEPH